MGPKTYSHGGYTVTIAGDGAIGVKSGDMISHYCMAKYHDFNDMETRFGRRQTSGKVLSFKDIPGANINVIQTGETVYDMETHKKNGGGQQPTGPKAKAIAFVDQFAKNTGGRQAFIHFSRAKVAQQLRDRVKDPKLIGQDSAGVCGPTAMIYNLAKDNPVAYVIMVTELFENGRTRIGNLIVRPSQSLLVYNPNNQGKVPGRGKYHNYVKGADWIPEASLRNSEDWFNLYPLLHKWTGGFQFAGPSTPWAIRQWLEKVGYTDTKWGILGEHGVTLDMIELEMLGNMVNRGYRVILLINHELENANPSSGSRFYPDHYVGLTAPVVFTGGSGGAYDPSSFINLEIFSHRRKYDVGVQAKNGTRRNPQMTAADALKYIWAYTAGRY